MPRKYNVVGIGEVLWDFLPAGPQMGGAPANFAYHAHALGANSKAITRVGADDLGREILPRFREQGLPIETVQEDKAAQTGTAQVTLSGDGLAHFTIQEDVAWDYLAATPEAQSAVRAADAVCFGSLAQRSKISRESIQRLVADVPPQALRIFDVNLRQRYYSRELIEQSLRFANILRLNEDELSVLTEMFGIAGSVKNQIEPLAQLLGGGRTAAYGNTVALTRGANGSLLYRDGRWSEVTSRPVEVVDTVGAGDSFAAAMALGLLHDLDLDTVNDLANEVARFVCTQPGATPHLPPNFAEKLRKTALP